MLQTKIAAKQKDISNTALRVQREQKRLEQNHERRSAQIANNLSTELHSVNQAIENHDARLCSLENTPDKVSVLYLGTSPLDEDRLRIDQEAREIHKAIRMSDNPQSVDFNDRWAVRQTDLLQALNETNPDIVHFSCHGASNGSIVFEDQFGRARPLSKEQLSMIVGAAAKRVRLVVFNACYSDEEANKVLRNVDAVIGMTGSISDCAAITFAAQLYSSIGFGHDLATAFNQAIAAIAVASKDEVSIPKLRVREGVSAQDIIFIDAQ